MPLGESQPEIEHEFVAEILKEQANKLPQGVLSCETHWYQSTSGRQRLSFELTEIQNRHAVASQSILPDGRLVFRFSIERSNLAPHPCNLIVLTKSNHPTSYPDVALEQVGAILLPHALGSEPALRLFRTVEQCRARDRYQRAVYQTAAPVVDYYSAFTAAAESPEVASEAEGRSWYSTDSGKKRLLDEQVALRNARLPHESRVLASGALAFVFAGEFFQQPNQVVAIFPEDYPREAAFVMCGSECIQASGRVDSNRTPFLNTTPLLVEVLATLIGQQC